MSLKHKPTPTVNRPLKRPPIDELLADEARFFKTWFENPLRTGAVSPSGRFLARMMARYVDPSIEGPIVELGPGTGPVTQALLQRGVAADRLILVEYDVAFCRLLQRRFPRCQVVQGDAYDLPHTLAGVLQAEAAAVVSSLPLLNRSPRQRLTLIDQAFELMKSDGCFVQFTYGMNSPIPLGSRHFLSQGISAEASPPVWLNLPPARVWIYRHGSALEDKHQSQGEKFLVKLKAHRDKVRNDIQTRTRAVLARKKVARKTD